MCWASKNSCSSWNYSYYSNSSTQYRWKCSGLYWGRSSWICSKGMPINWQCWTSRNSCLKWTYSYMSPTFCYRWQCKWTNWWSNSSTCYKLKPVAIHYTYYTYSMKNLKKCSWKAETLSASCVRNDWKISNNYYGPWCTNKQRKQWGYINCKAVAVAINWVCNNSKANSCNSWTMNYSPSDNSTYYKWSCLWINWWKSVRNCRKKKYSHSFSK